MGGRERGICGGRDGRSVLIDVGESCGEERERCPFCVGVLTCLDGGDGLRCM